MTAEDVMARLEGRVRRLEQELAAEKLRWAKLNKQVGEQQKMLAYLGLSSVSGLAGGVSPEDGRAWLCLNHNPVQHRDKRAPWCAECGRGSGGHLIGVPGWMRRLAREQSKAGERARAEIKEHNSSPCTDNPWV